MKNKSSFKFRYFSTWSEHMAYLLGIILADGCVYLDKNNTYRSYLCSKDMELLEYAKEQIKPNGNINKSNDGTSRIWFINKDFVMDLMSHGIIPRKTWSPKLPDIPKEYIRYFLLGLFDGDGSVWINNGTKVLQTAYTSYSKEFLQDVGNLLKQEIGTIPKIYKDSRETQHVYNMMFATNESLGIFHYFYDNNQNFYLKRKYNKFIQWLDEYKKDRNYGLCSCKICGAKFIKFHDKSSRCWPCRKGDQDIVQAYVKA